MTERCENLEILQKKEDRFGINKNAVYVHNQEELTKI